MLRFDILTLFPEIFQSPMNSSLLKKALEKNLIEIKLHNIRDYAPGKHRVTDDAPFGGGGGMVMKVEPVARALDSVIRHKNKSIVILLSPQGETFTQLLAEDFARYSQVILVCGHYEGVDERIREHLVDREISVGDYVLTGGEIPALIVIDAVSRLVPDFVGNRNSIRFDSFTTGLLEGPHYTRPRQYGEWKVPEVLFSGHQKEIEAWRRRESLRRTLSRRPDLLEKANLTEEDKKIIKTLKSESLDNCL